TQKNPLAAMFSQVTLPNGQTQLCWHEICSEQMTMKDARDLLNSDSTLERFGTTGAEGLERDYCWRSKLMALGVCLNGTRNSIVTLALHYFGPSDGKPLTPDIMRMRMGDLVALWGHPIGTARAS